MVTIQQIQKGALQFVVNDFAPNYSELKPKIVLGGTATLVAAAIPNIIERYRFELELANILKGQLVDIDAAYNAYIPLMGDERLDFTFPILGKVYLSQQDFQTLLRYIKEA